MQDLTRRAFFGAAAGAAAIPLCKAEQPEQQIEPEKRKTITTEDQHFLDFAKAACERRPIYVFEEDKEELLELYMWCLGHKC